MMKGGVDSQGLLGLWGGWWMEEQAWGRQKSGVLNWRVEWGTSKHCLNLIL